MTKVSYRCKYNLFHDKEVLEREPSSNNGWIYSAYAQAIGIKIDQTSRVIRGNAANNCITSRRPLHCLRLPLKSEPPMSRDEILGMYYLGYLGYPELKENNFRYLYSNIKVPFFRQLKAVLSLYGKHRNYVWENEVTDAYPIVFKLPIYDRFYIKYTSGNLRDTTPLEIVSFFAYYISTVLGNNVSAKNILWLQLKDMNSKILIKALNLKSNFLKYFGKEHLFNKVLAK